MGPSQRGVRLKAAVLASVVVLYLLANRDRLSSPTTWVVPCALAAVALVARPVFSVQSRDHAEAMDVLSRSAAGAAPVVVYHRPGCSFCARMKLVLTGVRSQAIWVDIWDDPEAAAFVRSVNDGDETVPTVIIDGRPHSNPDPFLVRRALAG